MEQWKDIPGYEGIYQASTEGRIRSVRVLKTRPASQTGYPVVAVTGREKIGVHVLVAKAFIGPRPIGMYVNHKDCDKTNARPENLEYVTPAGNVQHEFRSGNRRLYFSDEQMDEIADMFFMEHSSQTTIAKRFLPAEFTIQQLRGMRKRVRSVIEIWRAEKRPRAMKNPYERKLDSQKVAEMRMMWQNGLTQARIAKAFNVHPAHVSRILSGQLWKEKEEA